MARRFAGTRGLVNIEARPIAHFQFASSEALDAAMADPAMPGVRADIANFTDIRPTVMRGRSA